MVKQGEGYPSLTARRHRGRYLAGMLTESLYILVLAAVAFVLAVIAQAIW